MRFWPCSTTWPEGEEATDGEEEHEEEHEEDGTSARSRSQGREIEGDEASLKFGRPERTDGDREAVIRAVTAADLAYARTQRFTRAVSRAQAVIDVAATHGRIGVSVSGGKDSTVALALVRSVVPDAPAAWFDSGAELSGTAELVARQGAVRLAPVLDLPEMCRRCGWWGTEPTEPGVIYDILETLIYEPAHRFADQARLAVMTLGLRAHESHGRRMNAFRRGALYWCEVDQWWTCCPLTWWTDADVWAYIAVHELPYHPAYDVMARLGVPRRAQRIGTVLGGKTARFGSIARTKQIDPALYNRLAAEFPLWAAEG